MTFPAFFEDVPGITLRDPLAEFLGAADGGLIEYRYVDAVRLAGHSCPTVAGAWLLTTRALRALYGSEAPERGAIRVEFGESQRSGVAGVIASVAGLLTGAAGVGGFKGLAGRFSRRDLLQFEVPEAGDIRFARLDRAAAVRCTLDLSPVPGDPRMGELLPLVLQGMAGAEEAALFGRLWQERVRRILIDHHDDPALVRIS
ncbi:MAG: hypothetical protein HYU78_16490 [Rhodocyclales bacterium]|nr:hypothetical protein [Rhodocyclales bacterium]